MICGQYVECTPDKGEKLYGVVVCFGHTMGSWAIVHMNDGTFKGFGLDRLRTMNAPDLADCANKLQYLIDWVDEQDGLGEERGFTFPDGETWWASGHDPNG